jgi:hypothetical protein
MKKIILISSLLVLGLALAVFLAHGSKTNHAGPGPASLLSEMDRGEPAETDPETDITGQAQPDPDPIFIEALRAREYPGGDFAIEEALANGTNYRQYLASYLSEGLKIYGLLTVPLGDRPEAGWPAVLVRARLYPAPGIFHYWQLPHLPGYAGPGRVYHF